MRDLMGMFSNIPSIWLAKLTAAVPENIAGNHQTVDLTGAFIKVGDFGVAEPLLNQQFTAIA